MLKIEGNYFKAEGENWDGSFYDLGPAPEDKIVAFEVDTDNGFVKLDVSVEDLEKIVAYAKKIMKLE